MELDREIPVAVAVTEGVLKWGPSGEAASDVPVWIVTASEEGKETVAQIGKHGQGLLRQTISTAESELVMTRRVER